MKRTLLLLSLFCTSLPILAVIPKKIPPQKERKKNYSAPTVRVLIDEKNHKKSLSHNWSLSSSTGFILSVPNKSFPKQHCKSNLLKIGYHKHKLCINDRQYHHTQIRIIPKDGYAQVDGKSFHGSFTIALHKDAMLLINHVDLEEYVCAVLKTESWPGWPIEVNKVFAVASRSYVMAMIKQNKNSTIPYHVTNTNCHQTYQGMHSCPIIKRAVKQTEGLFLAHNNEPALAMFDACCGGIIPAHIENFDFAKVPYLARTYPCNHCKKCKVYSWKKEFDLAQLNKEIAHLVPSSIDSMTVAKKDKAGLVKELKVKKGNKQKIISGQQLYSALKDIKSFCYSVHKTAGKVTFSGYGFGHHIGICQWGAREMVRDGWPYQRILKFYYPGTKLAQLS